MAGNVTEAARLLARVGADTSEFESKMRGASTTVNQTGKNLGEGLSGGARTALSGITQLMGGTGSLIAQLLQTGGAAGAAVVAIKAIQQAIRSGVELQDYAQQVNLVADAYERFAGVSMAEGAPELREATQGVMSDLDAAQMSMKLMAMHLADSNEEAAKLLGLATKLTQLSGGDISGLLPLLTNQSALRLDEFLVSGDAVKKLQDQYVAAGMDSGAAFMKAFMEEAQKTVDKAGAIEVPLVQREETAQANLKAAKAQSFEGSVTGAVLGEIRAVIIDDKKLLTDYFNQVANGQQMVEDYYAEIQKYHNQGLISDEDFASMRSGMEMWAQAAALGLVKTEDLRVQLEILLNTVGNLDEARTVSSMQTDLSNASAQAEHLAMKLAGIEDQHVTVMVDYYSRRLGEGQYSLLSNAPLTYEPRASLADASYLSDAYLYQSGGPMYQPSAAEVERNRLADQAAASAKAEAERRAQEWQSFVSGLLQPTQVTDADMAATEMGVYKDKWDEPVRQFRMAEKGHNAYEISEYERKFYSGQLLDEVNWGSKEEGTGLIGAAMQAQEEEQGQENLLNTAMQKLSEAGIGLNREQVSNLLGLPTDYESVGAERAQNLETGLTQADIGTALADSFNAQIKAEASRWIVFGETMGDWLVEGLENTAVGGEFIDAVVALVLPRVQEALAGNSMP